MIRLSCVSALLIAPLLLLVTPSSAHSGAHLSSTALARLDVATASSGSSISSNASGAFSALSIAGPGGATGSGSLLPVDGDALAPNWALPIVMTLYYEPPEPVTAAVHVMSVPVRSADTVPITPTGSQTGVASWYSTRPGTCASPQLPFGTVVTVTYLADGASTTCVVEDRGPKPAGRVIDLSESVFSRLASLSRGLLEVRLTW